MAEVGEIGHNELERRHYPDLDNKATKNCVTPTSRRYIPHGHCEHDMDSTWRPHAESFIPKFTDIDPLMYYHDLRPKDSDYGPDWKSQIRHIPSPNHPDARPPEIWPDNWYHMRPFPFTYSETTKEWTTYPTGHRFGKLTTWDGYHPANTQSAEEISHQTLFGRGRNVLLIDKRNGIGCASLGDKQYRTVQFSQSFHKLGSTRPVVNFGGNNIIKPDTFVPLMPLPPIKCEPYSWKEKKRRVKEDARVVESLDDWRPATPLVAPPKKGHANAHPHP